MQKRKKFISGVCICLALIFILTLILGVIGSSAHAVTQSDINALKNQQSAIQQQKKALQTKISDLQGKQDSAIDQKEALDEQNELARQEIEVISEQIDLKLCFFILLFLQRRLIFSLDFRNFLRGGYVFILKILVILHY